MITYLDSSALVKLVRREAESAALASSLSPGGEHASSVLARVEVHRAVRRARLGAIHMERAQVVLGAVALLDVDDEIIDAAVSQVPIGIRSLDALHLASALSLDDDLDVLVTYDQQMASAADALGLTVATPR